jgi:hypothetical protein
LLEKSTINAAKSDAYERVEVSAKRGPGDAVQGAESVYQGGNRAGGRAPNSDHCELNLISILTIKADI